MKVNIVSFSRRGAALGERLQAGLEEKGWQVYTFGKGRYMEGAHKIWARQIKEPIGQWTGEHFSRSDALIFVGACGIAVRSIAPFIGHKTTDPAVVVVDERGRFAISLLSGHIGGGNELAQTAAQIVGAQPVVTTATDLAQVFAVDIFAKKNGCHISDMKYAKEISARLLEGEKAGFFSDFPWEGTLPQGLVECRAGMELGIGLTVFTKEKCPFSHTLYLIPRVVTVGIGCRKGIAQGAIEAAVKNAAEQAGISLDAIGQAASIDLKKEEPGLIDYLREMDLPFKTFSAEELRAVEGAFTPSSFVSSVTGVDNVCERSAVLASGGRLILRKTAWDGVTVAFAMKGWTPVF